MIAIVDDELEICEGMHTLLDQYGYESIYYTDPKKFIEDFNDKNYQLIILDIMMPGMSGIDVCKHISTHSNTPVIFLTALGDVIDKIVGLELGADDYIEKPCHPREFIARVRNILKRAQDKATKPEPIKEVVSKHWKVSFKNKTITYTDGKVIQFTPALMELFEVFTQNEGKIITRKFIGQKTLGREIASYERSIDVRIARLRAILNGYEDGNFDHIKTIKGFGLEFNVNNEN